MASGGLEIARIGRCLLRAAPARTSLRCRGLDGPPARLRPSALRCTHWMRRSRRQPYPRDLLRRAAAIAAVTVVGLAMAGCGGDSDNKGGAGLPTPRPGESYPGEARTVSGIVINDRGCFEVEVAGSPRLIVWPSGSDVLSDDAGVVVLPDDTRITAGDRITGDGVLFPVASLQGYPDGYWGQNVSFCTPQATHVLVLDHTTRT